jgi:soluble lytic murein transglycosylase
LANLRKNQTDETKYFAHVSVAAFSDIGRIMVYGSNRYDENALLFDRIAHEAENTPLAYYALFYAGRLYGQSGNNGRASERFLRASTVAPDSTKKDDALWYYFTCLLKMGTDNVMYVLEHGEFEFSDKSYFSGFFDSLALNLLQNKLWNTFYAAACLLPGIAADDAVAKYAYLAGRLLEERLAAPGVDAKPEAERLFRIACLPGAQLYYKLLVSAKLQLTPDEVEKLLLSAETGPIKTISAESGRLLDGYAEYGYPERIYPEWLKIRNTLADEDALNAAAFLQNSEEPARIQGIRIAANTASPSGALSKPLYRLAYPRFFNTEIEAACAEFPLPEYVMYGLVRSESFFERTVISHAGAHGLTQLMSATAADIAGRLKSLEYDVDDAKTNIRFGTYYLSNLVRQFEGSMLPAVFAYNAGATRVRTWLRASNLPRDLFLETIPIQETRSYGRNVLTAAALYGWLYYDVSPKQIVQEMLLP